MKLVVLVIVLFKLSVFECKKRDGTPVKKGDFPYMVQIALVVATNKTSTQVNYICGASLINLNWILTAGQCFPEKNEEIKRIEANHSMIVIMGSITSLDFSTNSSRRYVTHIIRHPNYQRVVIDDLMSVSDDIAVAKLNKPYELNQYVQMVDLILGKNSTEKKSRTCTILGFGETNDGRGAKNNLLRYREIDIVSITDFKMPDTSNMFASASLPSNKIFHGDIGSPVICKGFQFGLVSMFAITNKTYVDLYTRVDRYKDFIIEFTSYVQSGDTQPAPSHRAKSAAIARFKNIQTLNLFTLALILQSK